MQIGKATYHTLKNKYIHINNNINKIIIKRKIYIKKNYANHIPKQIKKNKH